MSCRASARQPATATPMSLPTANVTPAAASPSRSWRPPDCHAGLPVKIVIAPPIAKSASPLMTTLDATARVPRMTTNGRIGTTAPIANRTNDATAAAAAPRPESGT